MSIIDDIQNNDVAKMLVIAILAFFIISLCDKREGFATTLMGPLRNQTLEDLVDRYDDPLANAPAMLVYDKEFNYEVPKDDAYYYKVSAPDVDATYAQYR